MGAALTRIAQAFISLILGAVVFPTAITAAVSSLPNRDGASGAPGAELPQVVVRPASSIKFPANTDCNSPAHWDGSTFYLFNPAPTPWRSSGPDLSHLGSASETHYDKETNGGRWIESTWKADDGTLYGGLRGLSIERDILVLYVARIFGFERAGNQIQKALEYTLEESVETRQLVLLDGRVSLPN